MTDALGRSRIEGVEERALRRRARDRSGRRTYARDDSHPARPARGPVLGRDRRGLRPVDRSQGFLVVDLLARPLQVGGLQVDIVDDRERLAEARASGEVVVVSGVAPRCTAPASTMRTRPRRRRARARPRTRSPRGPAFVDQVERCTRGSFLRLVEEADGVRIDRDACRSRSRSIESSNRVTAILASMVTVSARQSVGPPSVDLP